MPILYPASLDSLTNPSAAGGDTLASVPHDSQHANANDAIEALETKLGKGASTPTTSGHVLRVTGAGATAYGQAQHGDLANVGPNDHHNQAHAIDGADHTASGLTSGHVLRATSATTFAFGSLQDSDIPATIARDSDLTTHEGAADPHTGYQKESEKGAASGYASLDASGKVPVAQIRGINGGTSFPASPTTNDTFFRTDRGIAYYYDGTRWLSMQLFDSAMILNATLPLSAAASSFYRLPILSGSAAMWLVDIIGSAYIVTNDASNYWGFTLRAQDGGSSSTVTTWNTSGAGSASWYAQQVTVGSSIASTNDVFELDAAKTGAPGNIYYVLRLRWRLVG